MGAKMALAMRTALAAKLALTATLAACVVTALVMPGRALAVPTALANMPSGEETEQLYLQEDVIISGKAMNTFTAPDGRLVNIVLGDFCLMMGDREIRGQDAVIWIDQRQVGADTLRDMEVYVEGSPHEKARVTESSTSTSDRKLFLTFHQQGLLRAKILNYSSEPADELPLFQRAVDYRLAATAPAPSEEEEGVVLLPSGEEEEATSQPGASTSQPSTRRRAATRPRVRPRPVMPVNFIPGQVTTLQRIPDPRNPSRRLLVVLTKGNFFVSQGNPSGDLYLSLQAENAVLYAAPEGTSKPAASGPSSGPTSQPAPGGVPGMPGDFVGAYLQGDVIMQQGDRTIRADALYYDFQTGRALIIKPVFREVQADRLIPVYVRAEEARQMAAKQVQGQPVPRGYEWTFKNAQITTSDFYTPAFSVNAEKGSMTDTTPRDEKGNPLGTQTWHSKLQNATFDIGGVPVFWWPFMEGDAEQGYTTLRRAMIGKTPNFGWGLETNWYLFRMLGLPEPKGVDSDLTMDFYQKGVLLGPKIVYDRERYSGEFRGYGVFQKSREYQVGTDETFLTEPTTGWLEWRHKQFLDEGLEAQVEVGWLGDKHFLQEFFPADYWTDKEQETLLYIKKQKDNWAITGLAEVRVNDFMTQSESLPDVAGYLIGQSLWDGAATMNAEARAGMMRYKPGDDDQYNSVYGFAENLPDQASPLTARVDTREELDVPVAIGPVKVMPALVGRATYWSSSPNSGGGLVRPWGQGELDILTHLWKVYPTADSRLFDVHGIRHVITPYAGLFWAGSNTNPTDVYPFDPGIEQYVRELGGGTVGVRQVWQTKRGPLDDRQPTDWLRWDISGVFFNNPQQNSRPPADGRYFFYMPEYSINRNAINSEVQWNMSDATMMLGDFNYDTESNRFGRADIGLAVQRDPRLRYYIGTRYIDALNSAVGTFGTNYALTKKYEVSFFEQYDFKLNGGINNVTSLSLIRKFPRLFTAVTFVVDKAEGSYGVVFSIWPEGVPELKLGGNRLSMLQASGKNADQ